MQSLTQSSTDINSLLSQPTVDTMSRLFAIFIISAIGLTIILVVLYIIGRIRKYKVEQAILDIQKDVVEIKQYLRSTQPPNRIDNDDAANDNPQAL